MGHVELWDVAQAGAVGLLGGANSAAPPESGSSGCWERGPDPHMRQGFGVTKDPEETCSLMGLGLRLLLATCITSGKVTFSVLFLSFWEKDLTLGLSINGDQMGGFQRGLFCDR